MKILKTCFLGIFRPLTVSCACMVLISWMTPRAGAADGTELSTNVTKQISALQDEKDSFTPVEQKMDSQLVFAYKRSMNLPIANGMVPQLRIAVHPDTNGMVKVDINAEVTTNLLAQIQA